MKTQSVEFIRNFVFGVEDSLVSTVGLVSGIAVTGMSKENILLTGIVLVFVEAFSMAVGSLLSENSVGEFSGQKSQPLRDSLGSSFVMFFSYLISGFVVVLPYLFTKPSIALWWSAVVSLSGLFILGMISARFSKTPKVRKGFVVALLGGIAIALGIVVGLFVKSV